MTQKLTTCTFCGVGCGIYLDTDGKEITGAYPSMSHPANQGRICVRGWHVHEVANSPNRIRTPLVRKGDSFVETSWDKAYDLIATRLKEISKQHGPNSIGFLNSARCGNEESYLLQKFARAIVGTNNVDQGTSLYRSYSIHVLLDMLGVAASTNSIGAIEKAGVILINDCDLGQQLPTIGGRVIRAKLKGTQLIVVGTRRHRVAEHADLFLHINPGTEAFLYGAMAKLIVDRGLFNHEFARLHCTGFQAFVDDVASFDVLHAANRCGIPPEMIEEAALMFVKASAGMILYSTGAEASGEEPIEAMVNLALLTGNLGREGTGVFPLSEHNNLQGGCDMGMIPDYLPGYARVDDPIARTRFEKLWKRPLPPTPGMGAGEMVGRPGALKAVWLDRHNPVVSATVCDARKALSSAEFIISQNLFMTRTAEMAHVILPVTAFGEEQVSYTSTERRIQLTEKVVEPPKGLIPAWQQITEVANRMGAGWAFRSPSEVMDEITQAVPFYEAATYDNLVRDYGRQWPCTHDHPLGTVFLFAKDRSHRPFRFIPVPKHHDTTRASPDFPFTLSLGQSLYYWHQNAHMQHSETLRREYRILLLDYPEGFVEINPEDAASLKIRDGAKVRLTTRDGNAVSTARLTNEVKAGMVYMPYFLQDISRQLLAVPPPNARRGARPTPVRVERV